MRTRERDKKKRQTDRYTDSPCDRRFVCVGTVGKNGLGPIYTLTITAAMLSASELCIRCCKSYLGYYITTVYSN